MIKEKLILKSSTGEYDIYCNEFFPKDKKVEKAIIACHGFGGTKDSSVIVALADEMTKYSFLVISLDFPSHGESKVEGDKLLVRNCITDINDVEKYLREINPKMDINFFSSSFGAYVTLLKINEGSTRYDSVILRCPAIRMKNVFEDGMLCGDLSLIGENKTVLLGHARKMDITNKYYNELKENDIFKVYNTDQKILIIHGTEDTLAPIKDSIEFEEKFKEYIKLEKIEGADHRFKKPGELDKIIDIATRYYNRGD